MSLSFSEDPKITYALMKLDDLLTLQRENPHPDFTDITSHKDSVIARYQPIFSATHIKFLSSTEFQSFFTFPK